MKILSLQQGSEAWLAHRRTVHNASEAPAMMGASPYVSRSELIRQCATGIEREFSDFVKDRILDHGHAVEPALRALAEAIIGEDLYPATGVSDNGYLGASFDGVTMLEDTILEAKQFSAEKMACLEREEIPPADYWQIVQQFAVCQAAQTCFYIVGDGTEAGSRHILIMRELIEADIPKLLAGWKQFDADVAAYVPEAVAAPAAVGRAPDQLPALHIEVTGMVTASNLREWKQAAIAVFQGIGTDLQTDQDFADAERTVKWCGDIEDQLKAAKAHALGQTASIDELFRTIDAIAEEARAKRLQLDKLVKHRKEAIRGEIVDHGRVAVQAHYDAINATLAQHALPFPAREVVSDLGGCIKGKKSLASMRDAVDSAVAQHKVAASQTAERVRANIAILAEHPDHASLFADRVQLCAAKQPDDLRNLVATRISEHEQREAARLERQREQIRQEEADRLEREQRAAAQATERERHQFDIPAGGAPASPAQDVAPVAVVSAPAQSTPVATVRPGTTIKLGDINAALAPLSVSADGLASLGFNPVSIRGAAKLYAGSDFPAICAALSKVVAQAPARIASPKAA